jgi:hypothetical protein
MDDWSIVGVILMVLVVFVGSVMISESLKENRWVKDSRGVWVREGNPSKIPEQVLEQHRLIDGVYRLYVEAKLSGVELESQCLGVVGDYAVDIVHVPRSEEDDLVENQCAEYLEGVVGHLIEIDNKGDIVRIV